MAAVQNVFPFSTLELGGYVFDCTRRLGVSQLMEVKNKHTGVAHCGKLIPKANVPLFLQTEGLVYQVLKAKPHPNIMLPTAVVDGEEYCGVVFDAVFEDLHSYVRRSGSGLCEREAKPFFRTLVSAVSHLHSLRIVLRDIRLGKVFFKDPSSQQIVLADLECAQVVSRSSPYMTDRKGSPAFVSPEVVVSPSYDGACADMWALGVVLYILLQGRYPFHDSHPATLFQKIQQGHHAVYFPSSMGESSRDIICSVLVREPHLRLTAGQLMKDLWLNEASVCLAGPARVAASTLAHKDRSELKRSLSGDSPLSPTSPSASSSSSVSASTSSTSKRSRSLAIAREEEAVVLL